MKSIWAGDLADCGWAPGICYIGGSSTSQKSQSQQGPVENPAFPAIMANAGRAQGIADVPFEAYGGQQVAPANSSLTGSWDLFKKIAADNTGAPTLNFGIDTTKGVAGYQPGSDAASLMNPFQKNVTDTTMADLERQRQIQRVNDNQSATGANAFGGARQGVADSLTNDAYDRNAASTLANLNFGNFNNAQNVGLQGAQLRLGAGAQLGAMSDQQLQQALARAGGANTAGQQQQTIEQEQAATAFQEFMRRIMQPFQGQQLVNASLGLLPGGVSQAGTSSGSGSSFGFQIGAPTQKGGS